jgi:hypothetical protein
VLLHVDPADPGEITVKLLCGWSLREDGLFSQSNAGASGGMPEYKAPEVPERCLLEGSCLFSAPVPCEFPLLGSKSICDVRLLSALMRDLHACPAAGRGLTYRQQSGVHPMCMAGACCTLACTERVQESAVPEAGSVHSLE